MSEIIIDSKTVVPNFDLPIKVSAGPGAGKTRWLVGHIQHVLQSSERLKITRNIACITYTNVAVETIIKRLGDSIHQVEVSTIHSFLYKHVVKPYLHFIASEHSFNIQKLSGHDDTILTNYSFMDEWKTNTRQQRITDIKPVINAFRQMKWKLESDGSFTLKPPYPVRANGYSITNDSYLVYKKMAWERGVLHHDDVLFFSYKLVERFPFILDVLRAKFPYFFIDEFQDIHPLQLYLVKRLAEKETTIVAIGDSAQSIYSFMGASYSQFPSFTLPSIVNYKIEDNWRSTKAIVDILNVLRTDIHQNAKRGIQGTKPLIFVGDKLQALAEAKVRAADPDVCTLSRDNILSNTIRKGVSTVSRQDLLQELASIDSNKDRRQAVICAIKAIEYAQQGYFKDALKALGKEFNIASGVAGQKLNLATLKKLLDNRSIFQGGRVIDLYQFIKDHIKPLAGFSGANPRTFYQQNNYQNLVVAVQQLNEATIHKTIHKSKGDEFNAVMLVIDGDENGIFNETVGLASLLQPNMSNEEHRICYVALSRAMNYLYINIPSLSVLNESLLKNIGFDVERLP